MYTRIGKCGVAWLVTLFLFSNVSHGQIIFSDNDFLASNYTISSAGRTPGGVPSTGQVDVRFNIDYSSIDIWGDGFLAATIPPSPRGGGSTTGVFLSANNDTFDPNSGDSAMVAIVPTGVNVGAETPNENYVMRVDVFHSTGTGFDDGSGNTIHADRLTNYTYLGINQSSTTVQMAEWNAPSETGSHLGQGLGLAISSDAGAVDDYMPFYGGARYADRSLTQIPGQAYSQPSGAKTGLISNILNDYWEGNGFSFDPNTEEPEKNLARTTGDDGFFSPDPTNLAGYNGTATGATRTFFHDQFPSHDAPLHLSGGLLSPEQSLATNSTLSGGVPYNQWTTHELYWVDGRFTYVIDGIPVLQFTPEADVNVFSEFSTSGAGVLGFWDRFPTVSIGPEGGNFVIYDNLEFAVADASEVPDVMAFLATDGYLLDTTAGNADFNSDGFVDGHDFLIWQRGYGIDDGTANLADGDANGDQNVDGADLAIWEGQFGTTPLSAVTTVVPEPTSALMLVLGLGCLGRVRRSR